MPKTSTHLCPSTALAGVINLIIPFFTVPKKRTALRLILLGTSLPTSSCGFHFTHKYGLKETTGRFCHLFDLI